MDRSARHSYIRNLKFSNYCGRRRCGGHAGRGGTGERRAGRGTPLGVIGLAQPGNVFRARAGVSVARGWQDAGVRGRAGDDARVYARVWCVFGWRARAASKSGQATRGSASLDVRDRAKNPRKNRMFGATPRSLE